MRLGQCAVSTCVLLSSRDPVPEGTFRCAYLSKTATRKQRVNGRVMIEASGMREFTLLPLASLFQRSMCHLQQRPAEAARSTWKLKRHIS